MSDVSTGQARCAFALVTRTTYFCSRQPCIATGA